MADRLTLHSGRSVGPTPTAGSAAAMRLALALICATWRRRCRAAWLLRRLRRCCCVARAATAAQQLVNMAYQVLSDEDLRAVHERRMAQKRREEARRTRRRR